MCYADVWYCILEGTAEIAVAEAQAKALVDLLSSFVTLGSGAAGSGAAGSGAAGSGAAGRDVLLAVDEFSAVSRRLPVWQLYERARSLGLAVQVSAQSWQGLADDESERMRIAASADGGIWLLRTPHPDPVVALAGNRRMLDTTRRLLGTPLWGDEGTSRVQHTPVLDGDIVRRLDVGQVAYVYRGGATFVQVKRLVAAPAALAAAPVAAPVTPGAAPAAWPVAGPAAPGATPAAWPVARPAGDEFGGDVAAQGEVVAVPGGLPDAGPLLDEAFGKESR